MKSPARLFAALVVATPLTVQAETIAQVTVPDLPAGTDVFALDLEQTRRYSTAQNFEVVGHSYLKVSQRTDFAKAIGRSGPEIGAGTSTVAVYDGIAYVAGYSYPPTLFGVQMVDVRDPAKMRPLGFVPCNPGTRCPYIRVDRRRKLLIFGNDPDMTNPQRPAAGELPEGGWAFVDVSDPSRPRRTAFLPVPRGATTHGMEIDGRYLYGCGGIREGMDREAMQIIDYDDPARPREVATWHVPGMLAGETRAPLDRAGPDGKPQILQCHEIVYDDDRLYTAWRDAGIKIFDVKDRAKPRLILSYDYVPPFTGGLLGAAHTALPVRVGSQRNPSLMVTTDEIFDCPTGFARIMDISDLESSEVRSGSRMPEAAVLSSIRTHRQDRYDRKTNSFDCDMPITGPFGGASYSVHLPLLDQRSQGLLYLTWYDEGLRAIDISNPYEPREIGYYLSPAYSEPGGYDFIPGVKAKPRIGRQTREVAQDPDTRLIYITDGNGGGLTALRYTGPMPLVPIPGAR